MKSTKKQWNFSNNNILEQKNSFEEYFLAINNKNLNQSTILKGKYLKWGNIMKIIDKSWNAHNDNSVVLEKNKVAFKPKISFKRKTFRLSTIVKQIYKLKYIVQIG